MLPAPTATTRSNIRRGYSMSGRYEDDALVRIQQVTKRYGDLKAVDDVDLEIRPGEIFALLGPNGAGKTTLIGCITGLITGFEGTVEVAGFDVVRDYRITRRLIGLVPQELNYDAFFNVRQVLEFQGGYFGEPPSEQRVEELLEQFDLAEKAEANTRWLSGGMKRRLMICKALMHDPALLFLDEPTAGVDVELRDDLWRYVEQLRRQGMTIVLTTHYLEEAEQLADRIGIINRGRLLRVDAREQLMEELGHRHLDVELADGRAAEWMERFEGLELEAVDETTLRLRYGGSDGESATEGEVDRLMQGLVEQGAAICSVEGGRSSLEEIFRTVLQEDTRRNESGGSQ